MDRGDEESITADGALLETSAESLARRHVIAEMLVDVGFLGIDSAAPANPAVEVLARLLPQDAEVVLCLSCRAFEASGPYPFEHTSGLFTRPRLPEWVGTYPAPAVHVPIARTEIVMCTRQTLCWTQSQPRIRGKHAIGDDVTLYTVPFANLLAGAVHDRHKGVLKTWIFEGPELSFRTAPESVDALCACIERAVASE